MLEEVRISPLEKQGCLYWTNHFLVGFCKIGKFDSIFLPSVEEDTATVSMMSIALLRMVYLFFFLLSFLTSCAVAFLLSLPLHTSATLNVEIGCLETGYLVISH
jgi:hypothetical protein